MKNNLISSFSNFYPTISCLKWSNNNLRYNLNQENHYISNCFFLYLFSIVNGGSISITSSSLTKILIEYSIFENSFTNQQGGAIYVNCLTSGNCILNCNYCKNCTALLSSWPNGGQFNYIMCSDRNEAFDNSIILVKDPNSNLRDIIFFLYGNQLIKFLNSSNNIINIDSGLSTYEAVTHKTLYSNFFSNIQIAYILFLIGYGNNNEIMNCNIFNNTDKKDGYGLIIQYPSGTLNLKNCIIKNNIFPNRLFWVSGFMNVIDCWIQIPFNNYGAYINTNLGITSLYLFQSNCFYFSNNQFKKKINFFPHFINSLILLI